MAEHDSFWVARGQGVIAQQQEQRRFVPTPLPPLGSQIPLILAARLPTLPAFPKCYFQMFTFPFPHSNFRRFERFRDSAT